MFSSIYPVFSQLPRTHSAFCVYGIAYMSFPPPSRRVCSTLHAYGTSYRSSLILAARSYFGYELLPLFVQRDSGFYRLFLISSVETPFIPFPRVYRIHPIIQAMMPPYDTSLSLRYVRSIRLGFGFHTRNISAKSDNSRTLSVGGYASHSGALPPVSSTAQ